MDSEKNIYSDGTVLPEAPGENAGQSSGQEEPFKEAPAGTGQEAASGPADERHAPIGAGPENGNNVPDGQEAASAPGGQTGDFRPYQYGSQGGAGYPYGTGSEPPRSDGGQGGYTYPGSQYGSYGPYGGQNGPQYGGQANGGYGYRPPQPPYQNYHPYGGQYPPDQVGYNGAPPRYGGPAPVYPVWQTAPAESPETVEKRRSVKRLGNGIGLALCSQLLLSDIAAILMFRLLYILFGRSYLGNATVLYVCNALVSVICMTVPYLFVTGFTGFKLRDIVSLKRPKKGGTLPVVMIGLGVCAVSNYASSVISSVIESIFGTPVNNPMPGYDEGVISFLLMILCIGIFPAIIEEFAFRGVILGALRRHMSDRTAILISAALFGLIHGNLQQIPFAFGVGLILAYATVYTGSIIPGMIIHGLNNTLSVVLTYVSVGLSPQLSSIVSWLYLLVLLLIGICGLLILLKSDEKAFALSRERSENTGKTLKWFCGSAWLIVFYVICALEIIAVQAM